MPAARCRRERLDDDAAPRCGSPLCWPLPARSAPLLGARREAAVFPQRAAAAAGGAQDIDIIENLGERVPPASPSPTGTARRWRSPPARQGKPVLVTLGYHHCPMLCSLVHEGLVKAARGSGLKLGKDFLGRRRQHRSPEDPKRLTPTRGACCAPRARDATRPTGRSGRSLADDGAAARELADAVGFRYKYDPTSKQFAHAAVAFVLTPEGIIARYLYGVDSRPATSAWRSSRQRRAGRHLVRQGAAVLLPVRPDQAALRAVRMGFMRIGAGSCFLALVGAADRAVA